MNKKTKFLFLGFIFIMLILPSFVSAQWFVDLRQGAEDLVYLVEDIFEPILGAIWGPELLIEKVALFVVLVAFIYIAISRVPQLDENKRLVWVITFAISILATRFFSDWDWFRSVLMPYSILGVVIGSVVPLMIFFFFIESFNSSFLRKVGWIVFVVIFFALWITNIDEFGSIAYWYLAAAGLCLIFLLFDRSIHVAYAMSFLKKSGEYGRNVSISKLRKQIMEADEMLSNPHSNKEDIKRAYKTKKEARNRIKAILRS